MPFSFHNGFNIAVEMQASLAISSAKSLPGIPLWLGIQVIKLSLITHAYYISYSNLSVSSIVNMPSTYQYYKLLYILLRNFA